MGIEYAPSGDGEYLLYYCLTDIFNNPLSAIRRSRLGRQENLRARRPLSAKCKGHRLNVIDIVVNIGQTIVEQIFSVS